MKPLAILTLLFLAPLLPGQDVTPPLPAAPDRERKSSEPTAQDFRKFTTEEFLQYMAGLNLPENPATALQAEYLKLQADLEQLRRQGLGKDHPAIQAKELALPALKRRRDEAVAAIRDSLQAKLDVDEARYQAALAAQQGQPGPAIRDGLADQDYLAAKKNFEAAQDMLRAMKLNLAGSKNPTAEETVGLRGAIKEQEQVVTEAREALAEMVKKQAIKYYENDNEPGPRPEAAPPAPPSPPHLKAEKARLEGQLKSRPELSGEPLLTFAGNLDLRDNPVAELHRRQLIAGLDLEELKANGLGADHPKVTAKTRMIEGLKAQLDTAVGALRETLQAQLTLVDAQLAALEAAPPAAKPVPAKPE